MADMQDANKLLVKVIPTHFNACRKVLLKQVVVELIEGEDKLVDDIGRFSNYWKCELRRKWRKKDSTFLSDADEAIQNINKIAHLYSSLKDHLHGALDGMYESFEPIASIFLNRVPEVDERLSWYYEEQTEFVARLENVSWSCQSAGNFLTHQLITPTFSRRLNVRSFLMDLPKVRLLEHSEFIRKIVNFTPAGHKDRPILEEVLTELLHLFHKVDWWSEDCRSTAVKREILLIDDFPDYCCCGASCGECVLILLHFAFDYLIHRKKYRYSEWWADSSLIVCEGLLETTDGHKRLCYLFDSGFVVCRLKIPKCQQLAIKLSPLTKWTLYSFMVDKGAWVVHGEPVEYCYMEVTDLGSIPNGKPLLPGSFSSSGQKMKHVFKVQDKRRNKKNSITLVTYSEYEKKYWMDCLHQVITQSFSGHRVSKCCMIGASRSSFL